jgi:putative endonuclease
MKNLKISNKIGLLGENIALKFLLSKGFCLVEKNYLTKYGEIDIICEKEGIIHFVEVKSVSCENLDTFLSLKHKPEEKVTFSKIKKIHKVVEIFFSEKDYQRMSSIQIDVLSVYIDQKSKKAKVVPFWNIIF